MAPPVTHSVVPKDRPEVDVPHRLVAHACAEARKLLVVWALEASLRQSSLPGL